MTCGNGIRMPSGSAADDLGVDVLTLVDLAERDLIRHETALNEHQRTTLAIRGLTLTGVSALIAASYASFVAMPAYFAMIAILACFWADFYYSALHGRTNSRISVLASICVEYRRLLTGRTARSEPNLARFRGDLRAYHPQIVEPDPTPRLWPPWPLPGRLRVFLPLYIGLLLLAGASCLYIETNEKPGTSLRLSSLRALCSTTPDSSARAAHRIRAQGHHRGWLEQDRLVIECRS
jgi:hypothetical protein